MPNDIIEKLPGANAAFCSMFTTDEKKDAFVNDYSYISVNTKDFQSLVNDRGYSLLIKNGSLQNKYSFIVGEKKHIYDEGLELHLGKKDKYNHLLSKVYVEFQKILDCKDLEITVGSEWKNFDNLVTAKIQNDDEITEIDRSKIKVESNVDTSKTGDYSVKYSYEILPSIWVSNSAKVKVTGNKESSQTEKESNSDSSVRIE